MSDNPQLKPCPFCAKKNVLIRKMSRRIHNQRVALRDNWQILEDRISAFNRYSLNRRWFRKALQYYRETRTDRGDKNG